MKPELVIFDWSGTISNDLPITFASFNKVLDEFGVPPATMTQYVDYVGADISQVYRRLGITTSMPAINKIFERNVQQSRRPDPIPGAVEVVKEISDLANVAVFSAHPDAELRKDLEHFGLNREVKYVFGSVDKSTRRDMDRLLLSANITSKQARYIGDMTADVHIAKLAEMWCAAVLNPDYCYQKPEKVRSYRPPADHYLDNIAQVVPLIKNGF